MKRLFFIDVNGKNINITNDTELDVINSNIDMSDFKDSLLASLYSQIEFLRHELEDKTG